MTIDHLPDEVLLEIFDSYRQTIDQYDYSYQWKKNYVWLNLAHVCKRWRDVMIASSSRLDLDITVGPQKPGHIKTFLSIPLPIFVCYNCYYGYGDITGSALWRMRAALRHRDRVREISFQGSKASFNDFFRATVYHFPVLESLFLGFPHGYKLDIPASFLRGPDQPDLRIRRLKMHRASPASVSGLLLSATALTDLTLNVNSNAKGFQPSQGSFLLACLQGMQCLRNLDLSASYYDFQNSQSQYSTPKDIVPLSKLTRFHYFGPTIILNNFMSGLSAPSLQDARFMLCDGLPLFYFSRIIDHVKEEFRSVSVTFENRDFRLSSSTHSGKIDPFKSSFKFSVNCSPNSIKLINSTPSTKLAMAEELALSFSGSNITTLEQVFSLREFIRQFRSVRVLRVETSTREVGRYLQQDDGEVIFPVLEQIELSISHLTGFPDEEYRRRAAANAADLTAFEPFVSACERAGHHVNVFHPVMQRSD